MILPLQLLALISFVDRFNKTCSRNATAILSYVFYPEIYLLIVKDFFCILFKLISSRNVVIFRDLSLRRKAGCRELWKWLDVSIRIAQSIVGYNRITAGGSLAYTALVTF